MSLIKTFLATGRFRRSHPQWPYVIADILCVVLVFCLLFFTSCVATGVKVTEEDLFQFHPGTTSYYDIVAKLGKPTQSTRHANGTREAWYVYTQAQLKAINFIPIAATFAQGSTAETTSVALTFDSHDRLVTYAISQGQSTTGSGIFSGAKQ